MWRLQLFLLLSTCFLIPYDAKPANASSTASPFLSRRTSHIGRLAAKDLADLLAASMQARGLKLTESQEATVKSLRSMEPTELQGGAVLLQLGMDVIIDVLIGSNADASCDRVLKDIKRSNDKNSLTLSLKSFLALCAFNSIECSQKQIVQIIKGTTAVKVSEATSLGSRSTRTALESTGKSASIKGDRDSIVNFLQARSLSELSVILSTLLQVCGASSQETQNIVQNLIEMGPKDTGKKTGVSVLQINGFSTLIGSLMDSLTSIANGNKSGFCAATPESWIVRLLDMGVAKVIIMGLMTALDRSLPTATNSLMPKGGAAGNLVDVPLTKDAPTAKRALPLVGGLLGGGLPTDSLLPTSALTSGLPGNVANQGGNLLKMAPTNVLSGDGNSVDTLANVAAPILAGVNVLNSVTGVAGGATGGGAPGNIANSFGNKVLMGPENVITGSGNKVSTLVGARAPIGADVNVLNSVLGTVTGGAGNSGGLAGGLAGGALGGATGGVLGGSAQNIANKGGNTILMGPENVIHGKDNQVNTLVGARAPIGADVNVLNSVLGTVTGASSGSGGLTGGLTGGALGGATANKAGNTIFMGPENVISGSGNQVSTLVGARAPIGADVNILNSVLGTVTGASGGTGGLTGGALGGATGGVLGGSAQNIANKGGNSITMHPKNVINGTNNSVTKLVDADIVLDAAVNLANSVVGTVTGDSGSDPVGTAGAGAAQNIANQGGNTIAMGPRNVVTGSGNSISEVASVAAPLGISGNILNSVVGTVTGGSSGGAGGLLGGVANQGGNAINMGPDNVVSGTGNSIFSLAKVALPVNLGINALNSVVGAVTGAGAPRSDVVQVLDRHGNLLMEIWDKDNVTASSGVGNDLSSSIQSGPKQIIMGDDNTIARAVNLDVSGLALLDLANAIQGSSGACNGIANKFDNEITTGPDTVINGNNNRVVTLLNLKLSALARLSALNRIIGTVGNNCLPRTSTPTPPTPSPPTPSPPTPSPPTPSPPTPSPPTPYPPTPSPPTPSPPTPSPPTPSPPTPSPPTPNPNKCYRRYCRKWRHRPSYLCQKNCGGAYVYRP